MNTAFPRLPMLHSIGRSSGIDMEEPPEDCQAEDENGGSQILRSCNAESINVLLGKFDNAFIILDPGGFFCNKFSSKLKTTSLVHCWKGAEVVKHVHKIKQMAVLKSKLEFQRDVMQCMESSTKLEELIKKSVQSELDMWNDICHNRIHCPIRTNLIELCDMCDDLRVQVNFWSSLWKRLFCNSQLRLLYAEVSEFMMKVKVHFDEINLRCISWLDRLVSVGFRVLAHCDLDRIEYEHLCNIVKGVEEYNLLVSNCRRSTRRNDGGLGSDFSSVKLSSLLRLLAYERSKYSAISCKEYLFGSPEFLREVKNYSFKDQTWLDGLKPSSLHRDPVDSGAGEVSRIGEAFPIPGMLLRISEALSSSYPPLMDFIRREKGFMENLLHAVCHVTALLSLEKTTPSRERDQGASADRAVALVLDSPDAPGARDAEGRPHKKSVSWNDSQMTALANFIASQYFSEVWQCFVDNFVAFTEGFYWTGSPISCDHLGCLVLSNDVVSHLISHVLDITAHKGLFPGAVHPYLLELSLRYLLLPSQNTWKMKLSQIVLPSPTSKSDLEVQLETFKDVSKSLIPFKIMFESCHGYLDNFGQTSVHRAPLRISEGFLRSYGSAMASLSSACSELSALCRAGVLSSLALSDLRSFLACSRSHVAILASLLEEACHVSGKVLHLVESAAKESHPPVDRILVQHLRCIYDEVNSVLDQLKDLSNMASMSFKELCSHNAIQFFKNEMPTGKMWKRKEDQSQQQQQKQQQQHSEYIEKGVEMLLKPVICSSASLGSRERLLVLSTVFHELCTAWMNNILEKKIKFSYYGACQLERDVSFVKSALQVPKLSRRLLALDIFEHLRNIVGLLKQQPYKGTTTDACNNNISSASEASSKSNSCKSDSKSNSIESSPLATKMSDGQSPQVSAAVGASNGSVQVKRPSKKNRSSAKDEKQDRSSKGNQDGRPKFGRSAKVSTNSSDAVEVQNNRAFVKDEGNSHDANDDSKDKREEVAGDDIRRDKSPLALSDASVGPTGNGVRVGRTELEVFPGASVPSGGRKVLKPNGTKSVEDDDDPEAKTFSDCEEKDFSDVEGKEWSPPRVTVDQRMARREEWLALRVRRGNRTWPRLPLCFSGSVDSCGS